MIKEIDHIGIAVNDLKDAIKRYSDILGLKSESMEEIEDQKIKSTSLKVGTIKIELLQTTHPDGPIGKFIKKKGEGVHHIALLVDNIDDSLKKLHENGIKLIDHKARIGVGGSRIAFIHPKDMNGVLLELVEKVKE